MRIKLCITMLFFMVLLPLTRGHAELLTSVNSKPMLNINTGKVGVLDDESSPRHGLEYRFGARGKYRLVPSIGFAISDSDASYVYTEARKDILMNESWLLTPSFGLGAFTDGDGLELGNTLEFRTGLELAFRFDRGSRLGLAIFHLSNGSISNKNPGTEAVVVSFMSPLKYARY